MADAWNELVDRSVYPNVFLRWECVSTWWKWFRAGRELHVVIVRNGSDVVGIVPWYTSRQRIVPGLARFELTFIGSGGPTAPEYLGPIVHRDHMSSVIQEVVQYLCDPSCVWDAITFPDAPPDDAGTCSLIEALSCCYPNLSCRGVVCPYIELPGTFEALLGKMRPHDRREKGRRLRKAQKECGAVLRVLEDAESVAGAFPTVAALSTASRARAGQTSPFSNGNFAGFHREVAGKLSSAGISRIFVLDFDGKPAAFDYGFMYRGKFYGFQTGFDSALAKYCPGDVLHQMQLKHLIGEGAREFDFLRGCESYKNWFSDRCRETTTTWLYRRRGIHYFDRWSRLRVAQAKRLARRTAGIVTVRKERRANSANESS